MIILITIIIFLILYFSFKSIFYKLPALSFEIESRVDDYKTLREKNEKNKNNHGYPNIRGFTRDEHLLEIYNKLEKVKDTAKFSEESGISYALGTGKPIRILGDSEKTYNLLVNLANRLDEGDLYIFKRFIIDKIIDHDKNQYSKIINLN